ncbi:MAG: molecular chaperone [Luteimonas sp.]
MRRWSLRLALAGALAAPALIAHASGLQVSPIGLRLATSSTAEAMWLTNTGSETIHAQVRVFRWTQAEGKDVLEPSRDLVVSPPMVSIAPGDRQLVRVIRQVPPAADGTETAYRVLVDELPVDGGASPGLKFVLRYSIPVFLAPAGDPTMKSTLQATWETTAEGPRLRVRNQGNGHAQIADVTWQGSDGKRRPLLPGLVGYTLPGATMSWKLPDDARRSGGVLRARINGETSESTLVVDADGR